MKLYSIDPSDSFWAFLRDHLHDSFGAEWWQEEMTKHPAGRHPFAQWEAHAQELMRDKVPDERGRYFLARDGLISAYLTLAYDLYVVKHNIRFKEQVLERLRHRDQFTGVRYELLVAATFVRAGSGPPSWLSELEQIVKDVSNRHVAKHGGRGPFDWVFCTSIPHQFGEPKQPDPPRQYLNFVPHDSRIPSEIRATIAKAILQYGNIPKFEDRPDEPPVPQATKIGDKS